MKKPPKKSRRSFVKKITAGVIGASLLPSIASEAKNTHILEWEKPNGKISANDTIRVGAIGMGIMGFNNCGSVVKVPGVKLVATCDLYDGRLERSKEVFGNDLFTTRSYERILERKDIDAVIVSTSDHWHDHISIAAMQAGKAVYCEKPMMQHIDEGKAMVEAQHKTGQVLQVGSQRVSSLVLKKAKELYEQGVIGQLIAAEAWNDRQSPMGAWQYSIPTDASEKTVDWDGFIGDAPKRGFDPVRFFRWRNYRDYGTGVAGDLFVHLFSGLHFITSSVGPERIYATGGLRYWKDGRDAADIMTALFDYPEAETHPAFNFQLRVNLISGTGGGSMTRLVGTDGVIEIGGGQVVLRRSKVPTQPGYGGWDTFETFTAAQQKEYEKWYKKEFPTPSHQIEEPAEAVFKTPDGYDEHFDHHANFINCIRENRTPIEDAVFGMRAAAPSLAANLSFYEKKVVKWDGAKMLMG